MNKKYLIFPTISIIVGSGFLLGQNFTSVGKAENEVISSVKKQNFDEKIAEAQGKLSDKFKKNMKMPKKLSFIPDNITARVDEMGIDEAGNKRLVYEQIFKKNGKVVLEIRVHAQPVTIDYSDQSFEAKSKKIILKNGNEGTYSKNELWTMFDFVDKKTGFTYFVTKWRNTPLKNTDELLSEDDADNIKTLDDIGSSME